jgi:hypothetical protein
MFGFSRKKKKEYTEDELRDAKQQAHDDALKSWRFFVEEMKYSDAVPLSTQIDTFSKLFIDSFQGRNAVFDTTDQGVWWSLIFAAVIESGTHPLLQVDTAVAELQKKYSLS